MTSLSYSNWIPPLPVSQGSSKRTPSIGKPTIQNDASTTLLSSTDTPILANGSNQSVINPDRVNALLDKMNSEQQQEAMNDMSHFEPIQPPENIIKTEKLLGSPIQPVLPIGGYELNPQQPFSKGRASVYMDLVKGGDVGSNYQAAYTRPAELDTFYRQTTGGDMGEGNKQMDRYLEKLNYLIYLLEENQKEKTSGITEEFILYCLFGVFIIFVVDGFARYGKNVGQAIAKPRYKR